MIIIIIVITMDGSCIVQIILSKKLSALAHTILANIDTDMNIIYTHTHTLSLSLSLSFSLSLSLALSLSLSISLSHTCTNTHTYHPQTHKNDEETGYWLVGSWSLWKRGMFWIAFKKIYIYLFSFSTQTILNVHGHTGQEIKSRAGLCKNGEIVWKLSCLHCSKHS